MSYGHLNIWLREMDCTPKNVWKVELVVKTCGGAYLVNFNPDIIDKLKQAFAAPKYSVTKSTRDGETTVVILRLDYKLIIKHIEVELPPGCYIVRAWVCSDNLWTDRAMAVINCGETACVNLIVPRKEECFRGALGPLQVAAAELKLAPEQMKVATEILARAGGITKDMFIKETTALAVELEASKAEEAPKYARAFRSLASQIKDVRM
jgi:hypothetical protein